MEIVVNVKTQSSHEKEFRSIEYSSWNPYKIEEYKSGNSIPADSVFLCEYSDSFYFKIPRPKPRSLPVLDNEVSNKVSLYFKPEVSTLSKFTNDLDDFVEDNIFTTNEESVWYYKYREFDVKMTEKLITVNIVGKN